MKDRPEMDDSFSQLPVPRLEVAIDLKAPLDLNMVQAIYDRINWSFVVELLIQQDREYGKYGKTYPISMCKALALPYLTNIPSLTELANRLEEDDAYRTVCGFQGRPPTRPMLWHFQNAPQRGNKKDAEYASPNKEKGRIRRKNPDPQRKTWFFALLHHVLIRAVLVGEKLRLDLPFQGTFESHEVNEGLEPTTLHLREYPDLEFRLLRKKQQCFPVHVHLFRNTSAGTQPIGAYSMRPPPWWGGSSGEFYIAARRESRSIRQSTACSALILSHDHKILLGKRKSGYRVGHYALPTGRWRAGETLEQAVEREVWEETGLRVIHPKPVSISFNRYEDHPECWTVGALVRDYEGQVTLREPNKCEGWYWYDLSSLPQPLFRPSEIIIDHYRSDRFAGVSWSEMEDAIDQTSEMEDAISQTTGNAPDLPTAIQLTLPLWQENQDQA